MGPSLQAACNDLDSEDDLNEGFVGAREVRELGQASVSNLYYKEHRALIIQLSLRLASCSAYKLDINATLSTDPVAIETVPLLKLLQVPRNSSSKCL